MARVEIRTAVESDTSFIYDMLQALAEHVGQSDHFTTTPDDVARDAFGAGRHYQSLIAEIDDVPSGLATYFFTYSTYTGRPCLFVNDLIVRPEARGLDLGRSLMRHLSCLAIDNGCCRVDLHVHNHNPARDFYAALGMQASPETPFTVSGEPLRMLAAR